MTDATGDLPPQTTWKVTIGMVKARMAAGNPSLVTDT